MNAPIDWLLEENRLLISDPGDLLNQPADSQQVSTARKSMLASQPVKNLMTELSKWPGTVLSSHKNAGQLFHKLTFLADLGLTINDPGMEEIVAAILNHQSPEGPFQLPTNIPVHFGGNGQDQWAWALCDAPLTVYAMAKFGPRITRQYKLPATTSLVCCAIMAGLAPSQRNWENGAVLGEKRIPAHLPIWPCSKHCPKLNRSVIA